MHQNDNDRKSRDTHGRRETDIMLARIDERLKNLDQDVKDLNEEFHKYVNKQEFAPVKLLVFGITGILLTSTLIVILSKTIGVE